MKLFLKRLFCRHLFIDNYAIGWEVCVHCLKLKKK